jgi:hypothetical protein
MSFSDSPEVEHTIKLGPTATDDIHVGHARDAPG